ncbi:MAG: hypothetical protein CML02_05620 [Pseudooceanicola sp.]|nr:hypothetical protein [Pseudooceanicola sp.]
MDGFLRRLAEMEFWPDVSSFLAGFGLRYGRRMIEEASQAEELLDLKPGTLAPVSPTVAPSEPSRSWRFERHHSAPVCPDCLAAGKPHHQSWRHAFVTCCVEHGLRLVDQCPMCQEIFLPGRGGYDSCHCGCPLDRLERIAANDDEIAISALISGKMHPTRSRLSPALAFRTPSDIGEFIFFLASGGMDAVTGKQGKTPLPRRVGRNTNASSRSRKSRRSCGTPRWRKRSVLTNGRGHDRVCCHHDRSLSEWLSLSGVIALPQAAGSPRPLV